MTSLIGISRKLILVLLFALCASTAFAQDGLKITDIDLTEVDTNQEKVRLSVYFNAYQAPKNVDEIKSSACSLTMDANTPKVIRSGIQNFVKGDKGVGVLFIFPISKAYSEDLFSIRSTLLNLLQMMKRPIDWVNAVPYDNVGTAVGWSKASESKLSDTIRDMQNTDEILPNLFNAFNPAVAMLKSLENVSQKYLVIISDAEGEVFSDPGRALGLIAMLVDQLKQNNIIPIVVGYSPDGEDIMYNVHMIKRIATNANGVYFVAGETSRFQSIMLNDVYDYIFKQYIYDVTLDLSGSNLLKSGNHQLQISVTHDHGEEKASYNVNWLALLKKSLIARGQKCTKWWGCRVLKNME